MIIMLNVLFGTTVFVSVASLILALFMTRNFTSTHGKSQLFWSIGLWLFFIDALLEILFAIGAADQVLFDIYLFTVAILVQSLSIGSILLLKKPIYNRIYSIFSVVADVLLAITLVIFPTGNILVGGIVAGVLPLAVIIMSSIISFPAAIILIATAIISFRKTSNKKMISIIIGTIIVSVAGSLYIVSFPETLYYAELLGIIFLWSGFFNFNSIIRKKEVKNYAVS